MMGRTRRLGVGRRLLEHKSMSSILPRACALSLQQQAFVEEMRTTGKVRWLDDFSISDDKVGFIAKVIYILVFPCPPLLYSIALSFKNVTKIIVTEGRLSVTGC